MIGSKLTTADLERVASLYREPARHHSPLTSRASKPAKLDIHQGNLPAFASLQAGCDAVREWAGVKNGLSQVYWFAMAALVAYCENGRSIFHNLSCDDDRYSAPETDSLLDRVLGNYGPRTCDSIMEIGGNCKNCPFAGNIRSPIALGYEDAAVVQLARRWVYVATLDGFIELDTGSDQ